MPEPDKPYTLNFAERPGYLYAHLTSETISEAIIRGYVSEIVAESDSTGRDRIMLVRDIPVVMTEGDVFHTVTDSLDMLRGKKLAIVNPHEVIEKELQFGMTVGQNRGGNYAVFADETAAEEWLLGQ